MMLSWMKKSPSLTVQGKFDFVDVRDVAMGHILAAEKGKSGEVYLLSGEQLQISTMRSLVQQAADVDTTEIKFPARFAAFVAPLAEFIYKISHKSRSLPAIQLKLYRAIPGFLPVKRKRVGINPPAF